MYFLIESSLYFEYYLEKQKGPETSCQSILVYPNMFKIILSSEIYHLVSELFKGMHSLTYARLTMS